MKVMNFSWWVAYTVIAICVQSFIPNWDALAPGFIIALQERNPWQTFWLFLVFTLIQEGAGGLGFGMAMLWYGGIIGIFHSSARFFVANNLLYMTLLSAGTALYRGFLLWFMCALQDIHLDYSAFTKASLVQFVLIPFVWGLAYLLRPRLLRHAH